MDNTHTLLNEYHVDYVFFGFEMEMALAIKWIVASQQGHGWRTALEPNLLSDMPQGMPLPLLAETHVRRLSSKQWPESLCTKLYL